MQKAPKKINIKYKIKKSEEEGGKSNLIELYTIQAWKKINGFNENIEKYNPTRLLCCTHES